MSLTAEPHPGNTRTVRGSFTHQHGMNTRQGCQDSFQARFERDCLSESAEVFKTLCADAAHDTFPSRGNTACFDSMFNV